jgi:hypothetical protein
VYALVWLFEFLAYLLGNWTWPGSVELAHIWHTIPALDKIFQNQRSFELGAPPLQKTFRVTI